MSIRVLSERIMTRGFEPTVTRMMEKVEKTVKSQPGFLSIVTLKEKNDHHKFVVLSEWKSAEDYNSWLKSDAHAECTKQINEVLDVPGKKTRIFEPAHEDIFLL